MAQDNRIGIGTKDRTVWLVSYSKDRGTGKWSFHHDNAATPWDLRSGPQLQVLKQQQGDQGGPDLNLQGVGAGPDEGPDAQVLLQERG